MMIYILFGSISVVGVDRLEIVLQRSSAYFWLFSGGLYNEPTISGFFRYLHVKDAATNSVSLGVSTSTPSKSDLAITATPLWALFNLSLLATNL